MPSLTANPLLNRLGSRFEALTAPATPAVAVEIAAAGVRIARRAAPATPERAQSRPLPPAAVQPSAVRQNLGDPEAVTAALRSLLQSFGLAAPSLTLLVPDLAARIAVLDFDALPSRRDELEPLARFRLRKSLPFSDEHAALSCQVLSPTRLLVAVADRRRLEEYEACLAAAGAAAEIVLPSSLTCLAALPALDHAALLLRREGNTLTTAFCWHQKLEFFRVLELTAEPTLDDLFPSIAFYRDRLEFAPGVEPLLLGAGVEAALEAQIRAEITWAGWRTLEKPEELAVLGAVRGQFA